MTVAGAVLGTVPYMSPEQSLGQRVEKPSDIFSLGVVCYELLGGERPFVGESQSAITDAILHREPRPLGALNPLVPDKVMATIQRMLEKGRRCPHGAAWAPSAGTRTPVRPEVAGRRSS